MIRKIEWFTRIRQADADNGTMPLKAEALSYLASHVNHERLVRTKRPDADLRQSYTRVLELAFAISLAMLVAGVQVARRLYIGEHKLTSNEIRIEVAEIPVTEQRKKIQPPARPSVPVPSLAESIPEDLTIESTELNLDLAELPPPPQQPDAADIEDGYVFIPYDEPPAPIGGVAAINAHIVYPEIARKANVQATVVVGVLIDERGNAVKTEVLRSSGTNLGFDSAAQNAVMAVKWTPAKQRDHAVKVWVAVPISFRLTDLSQPAS